MEAFKIERTWQEILEAISEHNMMADVNNQIPTPYEMATNFEIQTNSHIQFVGLTAYEELGRWTITFPNSDFENPSDPRVTFEVLTPAVEPYAIEAIEGSVDSRSSMI